MSDVCTYSHNLIATVISNPIGDPTQPGDPLPCVLIRAELHEDFCVKLAPAHRYKSIELDEHLERR